MKTFQVTTNALWACGLTLMVTTTACGRKKADTSGSSASGSGTVAASGGSAAPAAGGSSPAGVTTQADPSSIGVSGDLALSIGLALDAAATDTVLAFPLNGNTPGDDLTAVIKAPVGADGTFSIKLPQNDPMQAAIKACRNPDGTYDRTKLSALMGSIPDGTTDAQLNAEITQGLQKDAATGGRAWVMVTMASHPELTGLAQLVAQAESFKFIQLPVGKDGLLALPTSAAKGDLRLGQITITGDDAVASLAADGGTFSTTSEVLGELARTQKSLKFIRNIWMNTNATTHEAYQAAPYFSWASLAAKSQNAWETPMDSVYAGYGVGFRDVSGKSGVPTIGLDSLCNQGAADFTLTPPSPLIPVDSNGKALTPVTALDNANTDAAISDANDGGNASRMACSSQDTGFYAHSETGASGWNWGGNGYGGKVASGLWQLALAGVNVANFDMAAATPLDADGNPVVYIPAVNVTSDAAGVIAQVQIKLYRYDTTANAYAEVTDLSAFKQLISSSYLSVGFGGGSTSEGAMFSPSGNTGGNNKPLTLAGNVFSVSAADLTNAWMAPGSTAGNGQIVADSVVVQYQMYGNTYRFDHRFSFGN